MDSKHVSLAPRISEQTYALSEAGTYVFEVPMSANKQTVKQAIEDQFDVSVVNINIAVAKGKSMPSVRRRQQTKYGNRRDMKKAYVQLAKGDKIKMFEEGQ